MQATDTVVLHSNSLNVDTKAVVITDGNGKVVPVTDVSFVPEKELMYVKSTEQFQPSTDYVLTIPFTGNITDDLVGYYKSSYVDKETNETRFAYFRGKLNTLFFEFLNNFLPDFRIFKIAQMVGVDSVRTRGCQKSVPVFRRARDESHFQDTIGPQKRFDIGQ